MRAGFNILIDMTFKVTYKKTSGEIAQESIDAATRAECVVSLKERGLCAIRIAECGNVKSRASAPASRKKNRFANGKRNAYVTLAIAAICIALGALVYYMYLSRDASEGDMKTERSVERRAKSSATRSTAVDQTPIPEQRSPVQLKPWRADAPVEMTAKVAMPPVLKTRDLLPNLHAMNPRIHRDHEVFKRESDQIIADVISAQPGDRLLEFELGDDFEYKFLRSLQEPIDDDEKDTEDDLALKESVRQVRENLAQLAESGESVSQIIEDARYEINKIADYRDMLEEELLRLLKTESEDYIDSYVAEANALLEQYAAPPLEFTEKRRGKVRSRMEERAAENPGLQ